MSFRARLIIVYVILWILILALTLFFALYAINVGLYGQVERSLTAYVSEVARLYSSNQAGQARPPGSNPLKISFYTPEGVVIIPGPPEERVPANYLHEANENPKVYYTASFIAAYQQTTDARTGKKSGVIVVSQDTRYIEGVGRDVRNSLMVGMAFLLPLGALLVVVAARLSLTPLHKAAQEVVKRGPQNLSPIVYPGPKDDLGVMVERVNELLAELQEARSRERAFLAEVSHEIRTPITSLTGYLERLSRNPGDQDMMDRSRKMVTNLARLVGDLLALAKGEAERTVNAHIVNLGDLLHQAVNEYPGVGLKMPPELPEVLGDPDRLLQLARNLISNAVRAAGKPQKVQVRVWMVKEPTDNPPDPYEAIEETKTTTAPETRAPIQPWAVFQIVDWGPGINPEIMPRLFTRFARGPEGGTGLGLAIAKQIAEAHGGEIRVASKSGETRFTVFLPLLIETDEDQG